MARSDMQCGIHSTDGNTTMVQHGDDPWVYKKRPLMLMPSLSLMFGPQSSRSIIKKTNKLINFIIIFSWDHLRINWMANPIGSMYAIYGNMDPINIPPLC